jgi:glutamate racemase
MSSILVFDSGMGGLTVAAEIEALLPGIGLDYLCDDAFFPYGTKPEADLVDRVEAVVAAAVERCRPDLVVVACNTASTVALPRLRARLKVPVVGTVPAIKPAAALSRRRIIGVLGTPGTVRRAYTQDLIEQFAGDCIVIRVGSAELVELAEAHADGPPPAEAVIRRIMASFFDRPLSEQPDVIVLACTHFPLLRQALAAASPPGVALIDSGRAIAERVRSLLGPDPLPGDALSARRAHFTGPGRHRAAFTRRGFGENPILVP